MKHSMREIRIVILQPQRAHVREVRVREAGVRTTCRMCAELAAH